MDTVLVEVTESSPVTPRSSLNLCFILTWIYGIFYLCLYLFSMRNNLIEKEKKVHILLTNTGTTDKQIHNRYSYVQTDSCHKNLASCTRKTPLVK